MDRYRPTIRNTGRVARLIRRFESMPRLQGSDYSGSDTSDAGETLDGLPQPAPRRARSLHALSRREDRSRSPEMQRKSSSSSSSSSSSDGRLRIGGRDQVDHSSAERPMVAKWLEQRDAPPVSMEEILPERKTSSASSVSSTSSAATQTDIQVIHDPTSPLPNTVDAVAAGFIEKVSNLKKARPAQSMESVGGEGRSSTSHSSSSSSSSDQVRVKFFMYAYTY